MSLTLDSKQQRMLAVALFVLVIVLATSAIAIPAWSVNAAYRENIDQLQGRLQRLRQMAANDQDLRPRFEQIRATQLAAGNYLRSSTEAVAAAELQRILKNLAAANGPQVLSTQILPAGREDSYVRVALRAHLSGTLTGIVNTIHAIETNDIYLFLDNVSLRDSRDRRRTYQVSGVQFAVDIDLITYMPSDQ